MPTTKIPGMTVRRSSGGLVSIWWYAFWIVVSLGCLVLGVKNYLDERVYLAQAELDTGTIVRYELHVRNDGKSEYCPRIEFTDSTGEPVAVQGSDCPSAPDKSKIGNKVQVYWDPNNPEAYEEKSPTTGFDGLIFGMIGAVFFGLFWLVPAVVQVVLSRPEAGSAQPAGGPSASGLNNIMQQDAARYHANQVARQRPQSGTPPRAPQPANDLSAEEARLAQLKQQEAELQRKIDERRRQQGQ